MQKILVILSVVAGLLIAAQAQAHSELASSIPAGGSTVVAPKTITLTFTRELRLVTLRLVAEGVDEALAVDRSAPPGTLFAVPLPAVRPGAYTVKWRAVAADGHIMRGSFSFAVAATGKS
jgi:hypothetical protein